MIATTAQAFATDVPPRAFDPTTIQQIPQVFDAFQDAVLDSTRKPTYEEDRQFTESIQPGLYPLSGQQFTDIRDQWFGLLDQRDQTRYRVSNELQELQGEIAARNLQNLQTEMETVRDAMVVVLYLREGNIQPLGEFLADLPAQPSTVTSSVGRIVNGVREYQDLTESARHLEAQLIAEDKRRTSVGGY